MRLTVGLLACLSMSALSQAMAVEPAPQPPAVAPQPLPATATSTSVAPAVGAPTTGMPATVTQATVTPAAGTSPKDSPASAPAAPAGSSPDKSGKPALTDVDRKLMAQGYRVEMYRGEKNYCRKEAVVGTRFDHKVCATAEQIASMQQSGADSTSRMQKGSNTLKGN